MPSMSKKYWRAVRRSKSWLTSQFQENVDSVARKVNCLSLWASLRQAAQYFDDVYEPGQIENLNVLECPRCGLVYLNSDPVPYYRSVKRNTQLSSELTALRTRLAESLKHSLRLAGHQKPSLFEVGAHTGENLEYFCSGRF